MLATVNIHLLVHMRSYINSVLFRKENFASKRNARCVWHASLACVRAASINRPMQSVINTFRKFSFFTYFGGYNDDLFSIMELY